MSERERQVSTPSAFAAIAADMMAKFPPPAPPDPAVEAERAAEARRVKQSQWLSDALHVAQLRAVRFIVENPEATGVALRALRDWIAAPAAPHLLLRGGTGTGKTVAAAWLVRHCTEPGLHRGTVTWLYPDEVASAVLQSWDERSPRIGRFVVIDELGTETRPDFMTALSRLLDRDGCHVVMTSNLDRVAFQKRYGKDDRLTSRAGGAVDIVDIPGKDMRRPINNG